MYINGVHNHAHWQVEKSSKWTASPAVDSLRQDLIEKHPFFSEPDCQITLSKQRSGSPTYIIVTFLFFHYCSSYFSLFQCLLVCESLKPSALQGGGWGVCVDLFPPPCDCKCAHGQAMFSWAWSGIHCAMARTMPLCCSTFSSRMVLRWVFSWHG